ncbi:MAG: VOC family protein [Pseudomonadota bacterium]
MHLGAFSISLPVQDLAKSKAFYEALGFETMGDYSDQGWIILKSGDTIIGLFKGMFEKPMLTFNPGWDQSAKPLESFTDIRDVQAHLKAQGIALDSEVEDGSTGPASVLITDPDGNPILIDQHI